MEAANNLGLDRVVQAYQAIKDARTARRHAWEKADLALEEEQNKLKQYMLAILNKVGAQNIKTEHGTAYRALKVKAAAADWQAVYDWIMADPSRFDILERRVKSTFVSAYMEDHDGQAPPGINVHREYEVAVRRPNTSAKNEET